MSDPDAAHSWLRIADEDLTTARVILRARDAAPRIACFLAQQAAEKALKAALIAQGTEPPRVHSFQRLLGLLAEDTVSVNPADLDLLEPWAIFGRYGTDTPELTMDQAADLVRRAATIVVAVRAAIT